MWKAVSIGAAIISVAASSILYAQQPEGGTAPSQPPQASQESRGGAVERPLAGRLDALKERLRLTAEQDKNWPAYETAVQSLVKYRREVRDARQQQTGDPLGRMQQRAQEHTNFGLLLSQFAGAMQPLYQSLDEDQKRRFAAMAPMPGHARQTPDRSGKESRDDRRGWHDREDGDNRRGWRSRDGDDDRRGARYHGDRDGSGRDDDDRRGWRDRGDEERRGWRGRGDDDDRRGARHRDDRDWSDRDDDGRRGWRGRGGDDERQGRRGRQPDDGWERRSDTHNSDRRAWRCE